MLAVQGVLTVWPRRVPAVVGGLALMIVPGSLHKLQVAVNSIRAAGDPYFVFQRAAALDALESDPRPGGVLAPAYGGHMIPYRTGPRGVRRRAVLDAGLGRARGSRRTRCSRAHGRAAGARARRRSRARFVFVDCRPGLRDLRPVLRPLIARARAVRLRDRLRAAMRLPWALFAGAALVCGAHGGDGIQPNDEGLMLQAAARIADGQVPYRDFWWFYPPGQPLLLGGLWTAFGPSLLTWRVVRVLGDAAVAVLAWRLARRGGAPPWARSPAWLAATFAMAYPERAAPVPDHARAVPRRAAVPRARPRWPAR